MQVDTSHNGLPEITQNVRDGTYFHQARAWYRVIYLYPISDRILFTICALLAGVVFLLSWVAVLGLMPLENSVPIVQNYADARDKRVQILPLQRNGGSVDQGLIQFFLLQYVKQRESYDSASFQKDYRFVHNLSSHEVASAYTYQVHPQLATSPAKQLGDASRTTVTPDSLRYNAPKQAGEPFEATVGFFKETVGEKTTPKSHFTARVLFQYSGPSEQAEQPEFLVVGYESSADTGR